MIELNMLTQSKFKPSFKLFKQLFKNKKYNYIKKIFTLEI